jgi:hypothetical protein
MTIAREHDMEGESGTKAERGSVLARVMALRTTPTPELRARPERL